MVRYQMLFLHFLCFLVLQTARSIQLGCLYPPRCAFVSDVKPPRTRNGRSGAAVQCERSLIRMQDRWKIVTTLDLSRPRVSLLMSNGLGTNEQDDKSVANPRNDDEDSTDPSTENEKGNGLIDVLSNNMLVRLLRSDDPQLKPPPFQIEDVNVLFYDVFLILNLSASISFWVVHRMSIDYLGSAIGEGSLLSILWIAAGLYYGSFLYSAVDGHYDASDERGGPKAAGLLGLQTFIGTVNLRLLFALTTAVVEHRQVGAAVGEQLIPLEIVFGLVLMSTWRALHSSYTPRI